MIKTIKRKLRPSWVVAAIVILSFIIFAISKSTDKKAVEKDREPVTVTKTGLKSFTGHKNAAENEKCFKCHGQSKYTYENKESGKTITKLMYSEIIMDRSIFYESNHREFKCIDCHSEDYITFPHPGNLRMEDKPNCLDCHGGDEKYAKFHFENIDKEFQESVHSTKHSEDFTCWMCHNAHTYEINARTNEEHKTDDRL